MPDGATEGLRRGIKEESNDLNREFVSASPTESVSAAMQVKFSSDELTARIGLVDKRNKRKGFLGYIFEFGASSHVIEAPSPKRKRGRPRQVLRTKEGEFLGKRIHHPGMHKRPFFGPVIEAFKPQILQRIREQVTRTIDDFIAGI